MKKLIRKQSIFMKIIKPLIFLVVIDALLLLLVLKTAGVLEQLRGNSREIFMKQVDNRQSYLQAQMTNKWMNLDGLSDYINGRTQILVAAGELDLQLLDSSPTACAPLVLSVVDRLISELYAKQVSGIFLTFNTHDLQADFEQGEWHDKTGIHIRDNDPLSTASERNADLLLECAPVSVVQSMTLSTDSNWEQKFKFSEEHPYEDWLVKPLASCADRNDRFDASDYGLWSIRNDESCGEALVYTVPLVLKNGMVYGVLGVEVQSSYLTSLMPGSELDEEGVYALLMSEASEVNAPLEKATVCAVSGKFSPFHIWEIINLTKTDYELYQTVSENTKYEVAASRLAVYSRNAPFEGQRWYVMGAIPADNLYAFTYYFRIMLWIVVLVMLVFGFGGALFISLHITWPIRGLQNELEEKRGSVIPELSKTGIVEVDNFAEAITSLSRDAVNSSSRFLSIMKMSSIDMGGYELDEESGFVFVTDNYFPLFGLQDVDLSDMTPVQFGQQMERVSGYLLADHSVGSSLLYAVPDKENKIHYIHVQETVVDSRHIGVAEDVTSQELERRRIEHERDHDLLTGILNRRAFYQEANRILSKPKLLQSAVMVMIDLDHLKIINDSYGHEWGDRYIVAGAQCIAEHVPSKSVFARVSGDEFNLLLYGFSDKEEARQAIAALQRGFEASSFQLPDGKVKQVSASGGVSFAGEDSYDLKQLIKYADFAMYLVKHSKRGTFGEFDRSRYHASEIEQMKHRAFLRVVREEKIHYVFQPIVSAKNGAMVACEALMRVDDKEIANIEEFLRIARQEDALYQIEHLTWFHALEAFQRLIQIGIVEPGIKIFINSQVSCILGREEQRTLKERFGDIRENTVMEVVETDDYAAELGKLRNQEYELFAGEFALDDFGTGYNNEKNLLELMPQYIKLDMSLVRDVEKHSDRQKLISGFITFAHTRNMHVIAEGVETIEELKCLLALQVDLFQGYLFARPSEEPNRLNQEAVDVVRKYIR